jgi:hypothetical protein
MPVKVDLRLPNGAFIPAYPLHPCPVHGLRESATSIINRLTWNHCLNVRQLIQHLTDGLQHRCQAKLKDPFAHFNGSTTFADIVSKRLQRLTGLDTSISAHAWLGQLMKLPDHEYLSPWKQWCPACYQQQLNQKERKKGITRISDAIFWQTEFAKICFEHQCRLISSCPHCQHRQSSIHLDVEPGFCQNCHKFLGTEHPEHVAIDNDYRFVRFVRFMDFYQDTEQGLIAPIDELRTRLMTNLSYGFQHNSQGGTEKMAKAWNLDIKALHGVTAGRRLPSLQMIYAVCRERSTMNITDLFMPSRNFCQKRYTTGIFLIVPTVHEDEYVLGKIERRLKRMIEGKEAPLPVKALAKKYGVSTGLINASFYEELKAIRQLRPKKNYEQLEAIIEAAYLKCREKRQSTDIGSLIMTMRAPDLRWLKRYPGGKVLEARRRVVARLEGRKHNAEIWS